MQVDRKKTVTMAGIVRQTGSAAVVSTGGSLISNEKLKQLYATMMQCRMLSDRARKLHESSTGPYAASRGQEALATGCTIDLEPTDTIALAPHDSIAGLVKGVPLGDIVGQMYTGRRQSAQHLAHNVIPASASSRALRAATAVATTNKQKKNSNVVIAFTRKESTTLGYWHQALRFAARSRLPIIFVVENNPWAPAKVRKPEDDCDGRERSYAFPVITVDSNDVVAVYRVAYESLERVRQDGGPVLVEGKTYPLQGGRSAEGTQAWLTEHDPLTHMERYLRAKSLFTARWKNQIVEKFSRELDAAVDAAQKVRTSPRR
jgi:acetoin:2,6-dichlorophenolindophenol oxidoreductase subunit alpha